MDSVLTNRVFSSFKEQPSEESAKSPPLVRSLICKAVTHYTDAVVTPKGLVPPRTRTLHPPGSLTHSPTPRWTIRAWGHKWGEAGEHTYDLHTRYDSWSRTFWSYYRFSVIYVLKCIIKLPLSWVDLTSSTTSCAWLKREMESGTDTLSASTLRQKRDGGWGETSWNTFKSFRYKSRSRLSQPWEKMGHRVKAGLFTNLYLTHTVSLWVCHAFVAYDGHIKSPKLGC